MLNDALSNALRQKTNDRGVDRFRCRKRPSFARHLPNDFGNFHRPAAGKCGGSLRFRVAASPLPRVVCLVLDSPFAFGISNSCTSFRFTPRDGVSSARYAFNPPRSTAMMRELAVIRNRKGREFVSRRAKSREGEVEKRMQFFQFTGREMSCEKPRDGFSQAFWVHILVRSEIALSPHRKIPASF